MDRNEQLRYNNGIINSVQNDRKIGYCGTYADKSSCICMTAESENSHFRELPECNEMCQKQNINIYIKNYENRGNNDKFGLTCESASLETYPYYEIKSEAKTSATKNLYISRNKSNTKSIYTDLLWSKSSNRPNISNVTYYPYCNNSHQYIAEGASFVKKQGDNRSSNSVICNEVNTKNIYRGTTENDKSILNSERKSSIISSGTSSSTYCNNLYVSPPYFSVDKFVNQDQGDICRNTQFSRKHFRNPRVSSNSVFEYSTTENYTVQKEETKKSEQLIGIQFSDNPNTDKQYRHLPIKIEKCNHDKDTIFSDIERHQREENMRLNIPYTGHLGRQNNASLSIDHFKSADTVQLGNPNLYRIADFNAIHNSPGSNQHNMSFHDIQCTQYQKISTRQAYAKTTFSNVLSSPIKALIRETRKPNYRELINHVHALRTARSEDDLNMQIIKRTLNYSHVPKEVSTLDSTRNTSTRAFRCNAYNMIPRTKETNEKNSINSNEHQHLYNATTGIPSPLDLSVKTIKTNADSTESNLNYKILVEENVYPPKYNFKPNFSEKRETISEPNETILKPEMKPLALSRRSFEDLKCKVDINRLGRSTECYNRKDNISSIQGNMGYQSLENDKVPITTAPKINIYSLQNCMSPHNVKACAHKDREPGTGIKLEVTLKRTIPFDYGDGNELLHKKMCFDSFYHSGFNTSSALNKYSKSSDFDLEATMQNSNSISDKCKNRSQELLSSKQINATIIENELSTKKKLTSELPDNLSEVKQDVSSFIASRIRTKAELKGFIFQENKDVCLQNPLSNKQNCHCNYGAPSSAQMNDVDLSDWENTCNSFVDQLRNNCKSIHLEIIEPIDMNRYNDNIDSSIDNDNNNKSKRFEPARNFKVNKAIVSTGDRISEQRNTSFNNIAVKAYKKEHNIYDASKSELKEYVTINKIREEGRNENITKQNMKAIDLTKISVVRLKREKYASKRYPCNKNGQYVRNCENNLILSHKAEKDLKANKDVIKIGHSFPSINKSALRKTKKSLECIAKRQQNVNCVLEKGASKLDSITTRLQHQRMQLKKNTESICKNNNFNKSKRKKLRFHRQNHESELLNDPNKLFLEVYKYKRALKIPPNLITIKNPYVQRMSASLPDLDLPNSFLKKEPLNNKIDGKVDEVPKSIIDVLHSRVVKSKYQFKNSQKLCKDGNHGYSPKLAVQQCNNATLSFDIFDKCDDTNISHLEHRNVFETQVLTSRTRMEYKMQLNKEVLREIFGGCDRPASAPPEINNVNSSFEFAFKNRYPNCFQHPEGDIGNKSEYEHSNELIPVHLNGSKSMEQTNNIGQSVLPTKCKRKRSGRPYRRKFSSGFDYLRKRKKSNAHAIYNYSYLKTKGVKHAKESNCHFKNENDVCREIQKWVLNKGVGQSALHKAAKLGYIDVLVYCLEKMGLNPDHKDNAGFTPLHDACANGSLEIVRVLLQYGANHSEGAHSGIRPLHEASENGNIEIVRMLLSYGADPLLETYAGQTPLMLSSELEMNEFISMHLLDVNEINGSAWKFPGPWETFDATENGYDALNYFSSLDSLYQIGNKKNIDSNTSETMVFASQNSSLKNDICEIEIFVDAADAEGELFEFEEANMPLPPLYLLQDEGIQKWVLLSDLSSLLKIKSKDTLLNKIFPSISPATVSRAFIRELKMCEFLEKATCLQLLCAGEKINICHSKVVLIQYNENVRDVLGVKTVLMKF